MTGSRRGLTAMAIAALVATALLVPATIPGILIIGGAWVIADRRRPDRPVAGSDAPADTRADARAEARAKARAQDPLMAAIARSREARGLPPVPRRDPRGSVNAPRTPVSGEPAGDGSSFGGPTWVRRLDTSIRVIPTLPPGSDAGDRVGADAEVGERRSA